MPAAALALLLALAADPEPPRTAARTVSGRIASVSRPERSLTIAGAEETAKLTFDRNTMVFLEGSPGTVADLAVGLEARASTGPAGVAHWIEVKRPPTTPAAPLAPAGPPTSTPAPSTGGAPGP
ncbi:MAG TPA: hypothetical protein VH880_11135 [Anaeromyxobacteraceae bacterium]|jgi:hypothetical protein